MKRRAFIVALDGPSGAGKSTLARELAKRLGFLWIDTGALYRCFALAIWRTHGKLPEERERVLSLFPSLDICFEQPGHRVFLNEEDVSEAIRAPEVSLLTSALSAWPEVRSALLEYQRALALAPREGGAAPEGVILDGRDIGTVVFPEADLKFFVVARPKERARRRREELAARGIVQTLEEVLDEQEKRDLADSQRAFAPLKQAEDARLMDTSDKTIEQALDELEREIRHYWQGSAKKHA